MSNAILITGGAGYIGSHTVRQVARGDYEIVVLDNLVYGHEKAIVDDKVSLVVGDLGDKDLVRTLFQKYDFKAVIHFAAYAYVGESVSNPSKYYHNNISSPLNLLDVMLEFECKNFIFSSTCATYGNPDYVPIDENHPQRPINPYGKSKYMLEQILKDYARAYDLKYVFLRYFNASGASQDALIGEDHDPETHLIPLILDAINGDRENITVFGTDYDTEDGSCIRDYIHVDDLAQAHIKALDHLLKGGHSLACNLGTGQGVSVLEMIKSAEEVTGKKVPVVLGDRREGDPARLVANAEYAKAALGWVAEIKDIKKIIESAWNWKTNARGGKYND